MFKTLQATFAKDTDLPERSYRIDILTRVLNGTIYDNLQHAFHEEKSPAGEYVPLRARRPSVRYALCRTVVEDSVSLLFSEGHFPEVDLGEDPDAKDTLARLIKETGLNEVLIAAATIGSVGSAAIFFRVIEGRVFIKPQGTAYLTPVWSPKAPDTLERVIEQYKVAAKDLRAAGYTIPGDEQDATPYWLRTEWDAVSETAFVPVKVGETDPPVWTVDTKRTVRHNLGFVPVVWVRNLPGGDDIDGAATFPGEAIDTQIEVDYQLSQAGRGLKYSSDPTLLLKEPAVGENGQIIKGAGNALVVSKEGDAKMLEINGSAVDAVLEYVRALRELALETMHGNRANADKVSAAQSGRAMELMNQSLIWLADKLRISYGEGALADLLIMLVKASNKLPLVFKNGDKVTPLPANEILSLRWPRWFAPTASDRQSDAVTLTALTNAGIMSRATATATIAADYDIEDLAAEEAAIAKDIAEREANAQKQIKINE
jgi:hypothetical protein